MIVMFEKLANAVDGDKVLVNVSDIRTIVDELQSTHDSLMKENEQLNKQITLNTSRCLCYKGALEALNQIVEESAIVSSTDLQNSTDETVENKDTLVEVTEG